MLHSNRCLNPQDLPVWFPVYISSQNGNDTGRSCMFKHLIEQQGLSKHPGAFLSMSPRCEMNVPVTGILLLQFVPYMYMIMHWRMFTSFWWSLMHLSTQDLSELVTACSTPTYMHGHSSAQKLFPIVSCGYNIIGWRASPHGSELLFVIIIAPCDIPLSFYW